MSEEEVTEEVEQSTEPQAEETEQTQSEWQPDYSYAVKDDQFEFDELVKSAVTSKEAEEHLRQLYTKAYGLDHVKHSLERTEKEVSDWRDKATSYMEEAELAKQSTEGLKNLAKTDFPSFAHLMGIDDNTILRYANNRLDYSEKPDHEKRAIDEDMERRSTSYQSNAQLDQLRKQNERLMQERHNDMMSRAMSQPEINDFAKRFDQRMGEGAFKKQVRNYGSTQWQTSKQYVEPSVAVQTIYAQFKPLFEEKLDEVNKKESSTSKPPTNLGSGKAGAVVRKKIVRTADLHKIANELARQESY